MANEDQREKSLVAAAKSGDPAAFESLVRRHQDRVYRVCLRVLGTPADAEDATQDVFVQAWRALSRYRGDAAFSTWLHRIAINRCLKVVRAHRLATSAIDDQIPSAAAQPDRAVEAMVAASALQEAIAGLTPDQRAVLVLRHVEGWSYQEISEVLEVTEAAVRSRLNRARTALVRAMRSWA